MNEHWAFVDVSALRGTPPSAVQPLVNESFKLQCAVSARSRFALLDLDCGGSLPQRQHHSGCRDRVNRIRLERKAKGQEYDPERSLSAPLPTVFHLTKGNGLKILLAAQEEVGAARLSHLQHGLKQQTNGLRRMRGTPSSTNCVSVLTQLPTTVEGIQAWLATDDEHVPPQLPDPVAKRKEYFTAVYQRCQQLCSPWMQVLKDHNIRFMLLLKGYTESEARLPVQLLAYSLHLLLMSELSPGSCVCPVEPPEISNSGSWELDSKWPRTMTRFVLHTAGQMSRLEALKAKVQALKLAKDAEGDRWLQQQRVEYQRQVGKSAAIQRTNQPAAAAEPVAQFGQGTGSPGEPADANPPDAADRSRAQPPTAAAKVPARKAYPDRQPLKPTLQNQQEQQPANSGSVGCPANSNAGGSKRSGAQQPAGGLAAVLGPSARRQLSAIDLSQSLQGRRMAMPGLRSRAQGGLARLGSRAGRENSSLLPVVQLGSSQEPNSSAFTCGTGGSGKHQQLLLAGSQRELIPPVALSSPAVPDAAATNAGEEAADALPGSDDDAAALQHVVDGLQYGAESIAPVDGQVMEGCQLPEDVGQPRTVSRAPPQQQAPAVDTSCLAADKLNGNAAAEAAVAAVQSALQQLQAGQDSNSELKSKDLPQLRQNLQMLLEAASRAVIEACPQDQKQWSLGMSAAARKAVVFAIKELERMSDSSLKELAHMRDLGECEATAAAATAGVAEPDKATVKRARLRQGLLMLSSSAAGDYIVDWRKEDDMPLMMLEPMFLLLFCLHAVLEVGPLQQPPLPPPNMEDHGTRWSAKIQYVTVERHIDHFLTNLDSGWHMWLSELRMNRQERSQEQQQPTVEQTPQEMLLLGTYHDVHQWFAAEVLPGIKAQPYLAGLHALLSKWIHANQCEEASAQVPPSVDFDTKHQAGDPAALGALLTARIHAQSEQKRKERTKALMNFQKEERQRKQLEAVHAGEGMGTTEGVAVAAAAIAETGTKSTKKRHKEEGAHSEDGSVTRLPTKRRCTGTEVTSKPSTATAQRPRAAAASRKPAQALPLLKGMTGFPGKSSLRLAEPQVKKAPKQKPRGPKDLKEVEDDADSTKRNRRSRSAKSAENGAAVAGVAASSPVQPAAAASVADPQQKKYNKFARKKQVKAEPAADEQGQEEVQDELAAFGIDLGGVGGGHQQQKAAGVLTAAASRKDHSLAFFLGGMQPTQRSQQPLRKLDLLSFLGSVAKGAAATCTGDAAAAAAEALVGGAAVQDTAAAGGAGTVQMAPADAAEEQVGDDVIEDSAAAAISHDAAAQGGEPAAAAEVATSAGPDDSAAAGQGEEPKLDDELADRDDMDVDEQQGHDADQLQQQQQDQQQQPQQHNVVEAEQQTAAAQQQEAEQQQQTDQQLQAKLQAEANNLSAAKGSRKRKASSATVAGRSKQRQRRTGKQQLQQDGDQSAVPGPALTHDEAEAALETLYNQLDGEVNTCPAAAKALPASPGCQTGLGTDMVKETPIGGQQEAASLAELQALQDVQQQPEQQVVETAAASLVPDAKIADNNGQDVVQLVGSGKGSKLQPTQASARAKQQRQQQQQMLKTSSPEAHATQGEQQPGPTPRTRQSARRAGGTTSTAAAATPALVSPPSASRRTTRSQPQTAVDVFQQPQPTASKRWRKGARGEQQQAAAAAPCAATEVQEHVNPAATQTTEVAAAMTSPAATSRMSTRRSQPCTAAEVGKQQRQSAASYRQKKKTQAERKQAETATEVAAVPGTTTDFHDNASPEAAPATAAAAAAVMTSPASASRRATRSHPRVFAEVCEQEPQFAASKRQRKGAQAKAQQAAAAADEVAAAPTAATELDERPSPAVDITEAAAATAMATPANASRRSTRRQANTAAEVSQQQLESAVSDHEGNNSCDVHEQQVTPAEDVAAPQFTGLQDPGLASPAATPAEAAATPARVSPSTAVRKSARNHARVVAVQTEPQSAAARCQRRGTRKKEQQAEALPDGAVAPFIKAQDQGSTSPNLSEPAAKLAATSPPTAVRKSARSHARVVAVQPEPQSAAPEQNKDIQDDQQEEVLHVVAAAPLACAGEQGLTSPAATPVEAGEQTTPGSLLLRSAELAGAAPESEQQQQEHPVQIVAAASNPQSHAASSEAAATAAEIIAPCSSKDGVKPHLGGASMEQQPQLAAPDCKQPAAAAEMKAVEQYHDPPAARTRRQLNQTQQPWTAGIPVQKTNTEANTGQCILGTEEPMVLEQQQQEQQDLPPTMWPTSDIDGQGVQEAVQQQPPAADEPAGSTKGETSKQQRKHTPAKRITAAAGLQDQEPDHMDTQEPALNPNLGIDQDKLQLAGVDMHFAPWDPAAIAAAADQQQTVSEATTPQAEQQTCHTPGDDEVPTQTATRSRRQLQQRKRQRRQAKRSHLHTPSAAVSEDVLLSPADIDLENQQGEEEEDLHVDEEALEIADALGSSSHAADGETHGACDHAVSPPATAQGPSADAECIAVLGGTDTAAAPRTSPGFIDALRAVSAELS